MEVVKVPLQSAAAAARTKYSQQQIGVEVLRAAEDSDAVRRTPFAEAQDAQALTAQEILEAINGLLVEAGASPIAPQVNPEDNSPERTASRIVDSIVRLYGAYRKQNADLTEEEALARFVELAKQGVEEGYGQAYEALEKLGAFRFEGVESGIAETKRLIETKLDTFAGVVRSEGDVVNAAARDTSGAVLQQGAREVAVVV